jgi:hypothetical protein
VPGVVIPACQERGLVDRRRDDARDLAAVGELDGALDGPAREATRQRRRRARVAGCFPAADLIIHRDTGAGRPDDDQFRQRTRARIRADRGDDLGSDPAHIA